MSQINEYDDDGMLRAQRTMSVYIELFSRAFVGVRFAQFAMFVLVWSDHHFHDTSQCLLV